MREQELRIALVCFGGVSLAVYMHGISKEIFKLVRASCALHAIADRQARMGAQFFDRFDPHDPEFDTEAVYFELLREIGRKLELRVIVDITPGLPREASTQPSWRVPLATIYRSASCAICGSTTPMCRSSSPLTRGRGPAANGSSSPSYGGWRRVVGWRLQPIARFATSYRCSCARGGSSRRSTARECRNSCTTPSPPWEPRASRAPPCCRRPSGLSCCDALIEGARPFVSGHVGGVVTADLSAPITLDQIRSWREHINARVARC